MELADGTWPVGDRATGPSGFSDGTIARVGPIESRVPAIYPYMTASRDGRWAMLTKLVRLDSDLMRLDNFR